jgi:hypothetical protein
VITIVSATRAANRTRTPIGLSVPTRALATAFIVPSPPAATTVPLRSSTARRAKAVNSRHRGRAGCSIPRRARQTDQQSRSLVLIAPFEPAVPFRIQVTAPVESSLASCWPISADLESEAIRPCICGNHNSRVGANPGQASPADIRNANLGWCAALNMSKGRRFRIRSARAAASSAVPNSDSHRRLIKRPSGGVVGLRLRHFSSYSSGLGGLSFR